MNYMDEAIKEAKAAFNRGEVPVGAVIVNNKTGKIIYSAGNMVEETKDPTAHAELITIKKTSQILQKNKLIGCSLYVTLEPCAMCAAAISLARIDSVYFGAYDPKSGGIEHGAKVFSHSTCHHKPDVYGGIKEEECKSLLQKFFKKKR